MVVQLITFPRTPFFSSCCKSALFAEFEYIYATGGDVQVSMHLPRVRTAGTLMIERPLIRTRFYMSSSTPALGYYVLMSAGRSRHQWPLAVRFFLPYGASTR
jgi:hypothetical protein